MSTDRTIRPAEGRKVRHPGTGKVLATEGEPVTWGSYWERLHQAGDVEELDDKGQVIPPTDPNAASTPPAKAQPAADKAQA